MRNIGGGKDTRSVTFPRYTFSALVNLSMTIQTLMLRVLLESHARWMTPAARFKRVIPCLSGKSMGFRVREESRWFFFKLVGKSIEPVRDATDVNPYIAGIRLVKACVSWSTIRAS